MFSYKPGCLDWRTGTHRSGDAMRSLCCDGSWNNLYHDMKREIIINPMERYWFKSNEGRPQEKCDMEGALP